MYNKFKSRKFISFLMFAVVFYAAFIGFMVAVFKLPVEKADLLKDYLIFLTPSFLVATLGYHYYNVKQKAILNKGGKK